jgi:arylsulfatase
MLDRRVLPIPAEPYDGPLVEDAKDPRARFGPIRPMLPPQGAPNVLVILLDDVGFGAAGPTPASTPPPSARPPGRRC